jgi:acyl carrier protein
MNRDEILSVLRDVAVEVLGVEADAVTEQASFKDDLDADSLDLVEVVMALEEKLDIAIPEEELADIKTVGQAIDVVVSKVAARA